MSSPDSTADDGPGMGGDWKFDLGAIPDAPGLPCGGKEVDESYIWVPTTSAGAVSKVDTRTITEVATYYVGPNGAAESSSRTAVSADGRFVVVNNRGTGRTTVVAASMADCNGNNTSQSGGDLLPWGTDDCVLWSTTHADWGGAMQQGPRGVTWEVGELNPATCTYDDQKFWIGYLSAGGDAHIKKMDGTTGNVEEDLLVPGWDGQGYAPYGAALDPQNRPWFTGLRGELMRVNTDNNPIDVTRITQPANIQSYGMTVDPDGNPWMAGCSGPVSTYDVNIQDWVSVPGTSGCHRGMAIDHDFHVWVALNGPCAIVEIDGLTRTLVATHNLAQCSTPIGVSVDVDGFVWLVDQGGWAWKIDPLDVPAMQQILLPGDHYVYSDMTGGQIASVSGGVPSG